MGVFHKKAVNIEQVLTPTLAPGDIVIMDNLSCHKHRTPFETNYRVNTA